MKGKEEPPEILQAQLTLKGLSKIAWSAMRDEMNSESRMANIEQLTQLEARVLEGASLGTGNIELADSISLLTSALIFQEVADANRASMSKLIPFAERDTSKNRYTVKALGDVFADEIGYSSGKTQGSAYDLLTDVLVQKCPEFAKSHPPGKRMTLDSVVGASLMGQNPDPNKSRNPLIDVNPLSSVSSFLVARNLELCARFCVLRRQLQDENVGDRKQIFERFSRELMNGTTIFEKQMYGDPNDAQAIARMVERVRAQIRDNLQTKGRNILELLHRRFLVLSTDSDLHHDDD